MREEGVNIKNLLTVCDCKGFPLLTDYYWEKVSEPGGVCVRECVIYVCGVCDV